MRGPHDGPLPGAVGSGPVDEYPDSMKNHVAGLHHLTAIAADAQANIDF